MNSFPSQLPARQRLHQHEELAARIAAALPEDGAVEVRPGLHFRRHSHPTDPVYVTSPPSFCVIAQGSKDILLGSDSFRYDPAHYLISTMELPLVGKVVEATPERPYLNVRLVLDPAIVTSVMVESGHVEANGEASLKAVDVSPLDSDLLDAVVRLVRLIGSPKESRVLAPLVTREIIYRLLTGAQGARLRHLANFRGETHRMAQAIEIIHRDFDQPLKMEKIAQQVHMSLSGFHAHFKAATAMTPLQFQKQLRLQEARRVMLSEGCDAAQAGFRVGYEDASHFNRDYKRHFGSPPRRDVQRLRNSRTTELA